MKIWRILVLPEEHTEISEERLVRSSWSEDVSALSVDGLLVPAEADDSWVDVIVEADVVPADVDWPETARLREQIPWEREVRLLPSASVAVRAVWRLDPSSMRPTGKIAGHRLEGRIVRAEPPQGRRFR